MLCIVLFRCFLCWLYFTMYIYYYRLSVDTVEAQVFCTFVLKSTTFELDLNWNERQNKKKWLNLNFGVAKSNHGTICLQMYQRNRCHLSWFVTLAPWRSLMSLFFVFVFVLVLVLVFVCDASLSGFLIQFWLIIWIVQEFRFIYWLDVPFHLNWIQNEAEYNFELDSTIDLAVNNYFAVIYLYTFLVFQW